MNVFLSPFKGMKEEAEMISQPEQSGLSLFCIVAPEDDSDDLYKLFKSHLRTVLKDCALYESSRIDPGKNVSEEQRRLSSEATCCLAITSTNFFNSDACLRLLTEDIREKLLQIKLRPCLDTEYPYFRDRASLPRHNTIHTTAQNKEELCKEIAQAVKKFLLARAASRSTIPLEQHKFAPFYFPTKTAATTRPLSPSPHNPVTRPIDRLPPAMPFTPQVALLEPSSRRFWHRKTFATLVRVTVGLFLVLAGWLLHSLADEQSWFSSQQPGKTVTITTLENDGPGSLRQALRGIPQEQSAVLLFDASLQGSLVLTSPLVIDRNVTIEAANRTAIADQVARQQAITITASSPQVTITVATGKTVSFQNIQFAGIYSIQDINNFDFKSLKNLPQPGAFLQVNNAQVSLLNCEMSDFYSDSEGSALSNLYGDVRIDNSLIEDNVSTGDGVLYNLGLSSTGKGSLTLVNTTIKNNRVFYSGGAIYNLNGTLNVLGKSILQGNQTLYNDAEIAGGGAVASQGGMVLISDSKILYNGAKRDGGGILLVGANAQILSSTLSQNSASFAGNEIDVEPNHDNGQPSYLTVSNSVLQANLVDNPSQDVAGHILSNSQQPQLLVVTSEPFKPTNVQNNPDFLTIDQFSTFCQLQTGNAGQHFLTAAPSTDPNTGLPIIACVAADQTQAPLTTIVGTSAEPEAVKAVCQFTYFHTPNLAGILARQFNARDPLSWQCFPNEHFLGMIATSSDHTKLDAYCQTKYSSSAEAMLQNASSPTAYDWKCLYNSIPYRIQMDIVCQSFFDTQPHPNAISVLPDFKPYSWQCWEPA